MTYTGEVRVGGPSDARDVDGLTVTKIAVGPMDNNAYPLRCTGTGQGFRIDESHPATTLVVVASKTFSTLETLSNLEAARAWFLGAGVTDPDGRLIAVTAKPVTRNALVSYSHGGLI